MGEFSVWHWIIVSLLVVIPIVPNVFYILAIRNALMKVDEDMRPISPGLAWLYLIPVFNLVWIYFLVVYVARGYEKMGAAGRLSGPTSGGFGVGIAFAVALSLCLIPGINLLAIIPMLVLWILHWVQVHGASKLVSQAKQSEGPSPRVT